MNPTGYLRRPTLGGASIVFVCDDDLWTVPVGGGTARRLTAGLGEPSTPALSPDGQWLAYVGRDEQHPEVYVMPGEGGSARRLTFLGPDVMVRGWTPTGRILFVSTHGQPFVRNYRAFTIGLDDPLPAELPLGQVDHLSFGPATAAGPARVIGRNTADPARWKRYRGGTAGHLWVDAEGRGEFRRLAMLAGNLTCPMWIGERIYFLSDRDGIGNLHSCRPDGSDEHRHTAHEDFYARHASTDGHTIVYQCGARIWHFDPRTGAHAPVEIRVPGHRAQAARRFVPAAEHLQGFHLHPAGHSLALEVRGRPCTMALWEGAVRQHGEADGRRYRHLQWLADGTTLVAVADDPLAAPVADEPRDAAAGSDDERLVVFEDGRPRALPWDIGRVVAMRAAPAGRRVALANHRNEVLIADLDHERLVAVDASADGRTEELAWSPDGQWLAYPFWTTSRQCAIKLHGLVDGRTELATAPEFRDSSPAFDPAGRYLYFLSVRTFDPVYDNAQFELSFPRACRPYLIALRADDTPPFEPAPRGLGARDDERDGAPAPAGAPGAADPPAPPAVRIDRDGLARRVAAFPVPEDRYGALAGLHGKVAWTVLPIAGAHGRGGHKEGPGRLEVFDLDRGRCEPRPEPVDDFALAADAHTMVVRAGQRLRAIAPARKPEPAAGGSAADGEAPSRATGWIDLERVRVAVEPRQEWRQMLREVWRLQRDQFWSADLSGVDWPAQWRRYAPLLERVATRAELSDLIWELQGELGTSHAYESGGDHRRPPAVALGHLGAELRATPEGYEVVDLVDGDPWDRSADSPLNAVGVAVRRGERIVAVNGQPVGPGRPPQALLVHQAGVRVELTVLPEAGAADPAPGTVTVTTLRDETPARYRQWVERNRRWVHGHSLARVGYLHLPDMMAAGFAEFHRYFAAECDRGALIVDLRYNRGGHVSQLLLEKLARRRIGYDVARWGRPQPYPFESPAGPLVALTNEHAGSDGDIFSHCFKLMGIGRLVGQRTWGGVIGIWPRHRLVDGTETTQPEFSFWFRDVGWGVENHGTEPELSVDNAPQDAAAGRDRQLEAALAIAEELLEAAGELAPRFGPRPRLGPVGSP